MIIYNNDYNEDIRTKILHPSILLPCNNGYHILHSFLPTPLSVFTEFPLMFEEYSFCKLMATMWSPINLATHVVLENSMFGLRH